MSLETDIKWIKSELDTVKDPELIIAFKNLLKYRRKQEDNDWWDQLDVEEKKEIETGIRQANKGELTSHEEIKKMYQHWL